MLTELIIKVDNNNVHLSPDLTIPIQHSNIPIEHCKFNSYRDIYWKVELIEYNNDNRCWKMKVTNYFTKDTENFKHQKSTREIERIAFEKFDWIEFEQNLSSYKKINLIGVLENHDVDRFFREKTNQFSASGFSVTDYPTQIIKTCQIKLRVDFSEANFRLGYVAFSKKIKEFNDIIDFKIKNDFILEEFENIKSWFVKKLKTKKFTVNATITTADSIVTEVIATSPQIALIDAQMVDSISYQRTLALTKSPKVSNKDRSIFTAEEIFKEIDTADIEGNVFNQNEQDILNFLLDHFKRRNRKQLEYLSENKHSEDFKLRFTLHPNFGFLFFIEGKQNNHFVWELLNSHATYIWSIAKSGQEVDLQYKRIEASINTIRDSGREQYKRAYRQNNHDNDLIFCVLEHDNITSNVVDGFVQWKHKLNEKTA